MKNSRNLILAAGALLIMPMGAAWADDITLNLDTAVFTANPGDTLLFTGTITSLDSNYVVDLNGCAVNMSGQFATDCTASFLTYAPFSVNPLDTTSDFAMFTVDVDIPYTDPFGPQTGTFDVYGGEETDGYDPTTQNFLGEADFTVDVAPEPGTAVLLGLAGAMLAIARRRTRGRQ